MLYIYAAGIFQTAVTAFLLKVCCKQNRYSAYLFLFVLCLLLHLISNFLLYYFVQDDYFRKGFFSFLTLAYGPLIWAYTRKQTDPDYSAAVSFLNFIPTCIWGMAYLIILGRWIENPDADFEYIKYYNRSILLVMPVINIPYFILSIRQTRSLEAGLINERQLILFISGVSTGLIIFTCMFALVAIATDMPFNPAQKFAKSVAASGMILICVAILRYKVFPRNNSKIPNARPAVPLASDETAIMPAMPQEVDQKEADNRKEGKIFLLSREKQQEIYEQLNTVMKEKKLFLDPDMNMEKLAVATNISRHYISETLNNYANKSFYSFINEHRVKMVCEQMHKTSYQTSMVTLQYLGNSCGFKSKTSFNDNFKKITGLTPSEYWRELVDTNMLEKANR